jgi:ABC-2 type transport system permease protein
VILMLLTVGHLGFGVRIQSPGPLALGIICIALSSVGLTMMLSVIGKTESAVGGGSWAVLLIFGMLGGGMVPQMFMPNWMTIASNLSPVKWAILTLEGGIWRQFSWQDVLRPGLILIGEGVLFATIGLSVLQRTER